MSDWNNTVAKALEVASIAHKKQTRKKTDIPYIVHPVEVALILQSEGLSDDIIAAGLLHDTLEDTPVCQKYIRKHFGKKILNLVVGATEKEKLKESKGKSDKIKEKNDWEKRKRNTIEYLKNEAPLEVKYIACADKLSNIRSMLRDYKEVGEELWDRFNVGYEKQKDYYRGLVESLKDLEDLTMYQEFKRAVKELF